VRVARCGHEEWDTDKANAEHIAAADPPFMLAVADWLDWVAPFADLPSPAFVVGHALAVARAYVGGAS
jgi:hypothetical protein